MFNPLLAFLPLSHTASAAKQLRVARGVTPLILPLPLPLPLPITHPHRMASSLLPTWYMANALLAAAKLKAGARAAALPKHFSASDQRAMPAQHKQQQQAVSSRKEDIYTLHLPYNAYTHGKQCIHVSACDK